MKIGLKLTFALVLSQTLLASVASVAETVTFQVPLTYDNFDPGATINVQVYCALTGDQGQVYGGNAVLVPLTAGQYSGTVSVPVARYDGAPKPTGWQCQAYSWRIKYQWQQGADTVCYYGLDKTWPCQNQCPGSGPTPCAILVEGKFP